MPVFQCHEKSSSAKDFECHTELHNIFAVEKHSNKIAVIYDDGESIPVTQTYAQIYSMASCIQSYFISHPEPGGFVGVACHQNIIFPAVLLGIMRAKCGFYNINLSNLLEDIKFAQFTISMKYLVIEDSIFQRVISKLKSTLKRKIASYEYKEGNRVGMLHIFLLVDSVLTVHRKQKSDQYSYAIRTSGTTGSKKMVLVPSSCIVANIIYFIQSAWKMSSNDIIFGSSPVTFDPSIVELFCALGSGSKILYVPQRVKLVGDLLAILLMKHKVTILQITPSLFRRIEKSLVSEGIFNSEKSSLEVLAFGGEKCLEKEELRKIIDARMFSKLRQRGLQNLYGITEVSCWASVENIDLDSESNITIGNPILNTSIHIGDDGSISIGSETRVCTILNSNGDQVTCSFKENDTYFYDTGDIGVINEEMTGIIYVTRKDRIVKRNGYKTSLIEIENSAMATNLLSTASCVFYKDKIYLVIQLIADTESQTHLTTAQRINEEFIPKLCLDIPPQIYPDVIVPVEDIPVNQNGKIDMDRIISIAEYQRYKNAMHQRGLSHVHFNFQKELFLQALENIWLMCTNQLGRHDPLHQNEHLIPKRFVEAGGDSLSAVRFIEEAFTYLNLFGSDTHAKFEKDVFKLLILEDFDKVSDFLCDIGEHHPVNVSVTAVTTLPTGENESSNLDSISSRHSTNTSSHENSPLECTSETLHQENPFSTKYVRKRKHVKKNSPKISAKNPPELIFSCSYDLRMCVDSSVAVINGLNFVNGAVVVIGSHSGYAIGIALGRIANQDNLQAADTFPIQWETHLGGRIEATVAVHPNHLAVYIGTHSKRLYSLSVLTGHIIWRFECNDSVRAAPVVSSNGKILIFVDENSLYSLNPYNGSLFWRRDNLRHMSTLSPTIDTLIFLTTATNKIIAVDLKKGNIMWTRSGKSSDMSTAYCTAPILVKSKNNSQQLLLVGTRNGRLEALNQNNGEIIWTCEELQVDKFSPNSVPFDPITHICCCDNSDCDDYIIFINRIGKGVVIFPEAGTVLRSFELNLNTSSPPCIICTNKTSGSLEPCLKSPSREEKNTDKISSSKATYLVFYTEGVLTFVDISNPNSRLNFKTDFDTQAANFSKPVVHNNYILVGGRDNKLHVFELASFTHEIK